MLVARVWGIKSTGQKQVSIPKGSDIQVGDYVKVIKIFNEDEDAIIKISDGVEKNDADDTTGKA